MNNRTKACKIKGSGCGILLWNFRTKPVDDCQFGVIFFLIISTVLRVDSDFSMSATMVLQAWITVVWSFFPIMVPMDFKGIPMISLQRYMAIL